MSDTELTIEEKIRLARAPITRGILATAGGIHALRGMAHAGCGERPSTPVFNDAGRQVGKRALRMTDGE